MSDANKYVIEKRVGDSDWDTVGTVEGVKSFRVSDLTPDTSYDFRVKGVNVIDGEEYSGEYSDVVSVRTLSSIDVAVPTGLSVSMDWDRAVLTWNSVDGATGYELQYKSLNEPDWVSLSRTDLLTQTVSSLSEGVSYSFRLRAVVVYDVYTFYSDWTGVVEDVTLVQVPSVPLDLAGDPYGDYIDISWGVSSLATKYVLEYKIQDGQFSELYSGTDFSYRHSGLTVDTDYFYRVKAVREINGITSESDFTSEVQVNTGQIRLAIPSDFSLTFSDYTSVDFSWGLVENATSYEISYLKGESDEFVVAGTFEGTTAKVSELSDGFSYKFRVRAVGEGGLFSDYSELVDVSLPLYVLSVPVLPNVIPDSVTGGGHVIFNPMVEGTTGILVANYGNASDKDFIQKVYISLGLSEDSMEESEVLFLKDSNFFVTSFDAGLLVENSNYFVKVRLYRAVGGVDYYTDFSNILSFKTDYKKPPELSQVNAVVDLTTVKLSWVYSSDDDLSEGVLVRFRVREGSTTGEWQELGSYERNVLRHDFEGEPITLYDFSFTTYRYIDNAPVYSDDSTIKSGVQIGSLSWEDVVLSSASAPSFLSMSFSLVKQNEMNKADGFYAMYDFNYAGGSSGAIGMDSYIDFKKYANFVDASALVESGSSSQFKIQSSYKLQSTRVTNCSCCVLPFRYTDSITFKSIKIDCGSLWDNSVSSNSVIFVIGKLLFKDSSGIVPLSVTGSDLKYTGVYGDVAFTIDLTNPVRTSEAVGNLTDIFNMDNLDTKVIFDVGDGERGSFTITFDSEVSFSEVILYPSTSYDGYTGGMNVSIWGNFSVRFFDALGAAIEGVDVSMGISDFKSIDSFSFKGKTFGNYSNAVRFTIY